MNKRNEKEGYNTSKYAIYFMKTIQQIINRGNNVEVKRGRDGELVIYEVKKSISSIG